ncbi:SIR2 family protein [Nocardia sp. NBC_00508]|uniref:SIR2 family protein n=1 Tax=Nocardia sp. NBC_00508 TaxID=2975992 RepID=UPI002E81E426|nr:SIR2 family protein [Nocardia sp. NBC_00508]WUD69607.1 SIR2 family protein [Nocardia sp. NBC_00508]
MSQTNENLFTRSEVRFFSSQQTKYAIAEVFRRSHTVIYCGAGVSIDRTGLGWQQLVSSIRPGGDSVKPAHLGALARFLDPARQATAVVNSLSEQYPALGADAEVCWQVQNQLRLELYKKAHTWQYGTLMRNIVSFAIMRAIAGGTVTILTTNFDIHLEDEARSFIQDSDRILGELGVNVNTRVRFAEEFENPGGAMQDGTAPDDDEPVVEIVYLHGRVHKDAAQQTACRVVLDEVDYGETSEMTVRILRQYFSARDSSLIIVGASLTDAPLIEALARERNGGAFRTRSGPDNQYRLFLLPLSTVKSNDDPPKRVHNLTCSDAQNLIRLLAGRCKRLGVNMLAADFKYQVSQFFRELVICTSLGSTDAYFSTTNRSTYGRRLVRWWEEWNDAANADIHHFTRQYLRLDATVSAIRKKFVLPSGERLKLELWVRYGVEKERQLVLCASSAGVLYNRRLLRREELSLNSKQVSMRAFIDGQVSYVDNSKDAGQYSRWRSFLSVPIFLNAENREFFAGVITLSSSEYIGHTGLPHQNAESMLSLVNVIRRCGIQLLEPEQTAVKGRRLSRASL